MIPKDYTKILDNSVAARVVKSHESAIALSAFVVVRRCMYRSISE